MTDKKRILVIRLGALGDLVLCFQAFHEIRREHPKAKIALLTMPAFAAFAKAMPWFDEVLVDARAPLRDLVKWVQLIRDVRRFNPDRVYDLQGKFRQTLLFAALGGPLREWSGAAPLCAFPRLWPPRKGMHYTDFLAAQLRLTRVPSQAPVDLPWLDAPTHELGLPDRYVVLIPGCAPGREYKRWPAKHYAALAQRFYDQGTAVVAVGTKADADAIGALRAEAAFVIDVSGRTNLLQLAGLARRSIGVIGNDTGPTHLAAAVGARTLALFSEQVDPVWSAPKGENTAYLQAAPLESLSVDEVFVAFNARGAKS